jgi:hypothetical protein
MPKIGNVVTFTYSTFARRDIPADPDVVRVRFDLSWEEIKRNYDYELKYLNGMLQICSTSLCVNFLFFFQKVHE